jgi:RNA-directed DNA polymerase
VGFEHRTDAERFLAALRARFAKFNLELHPEKTRLLEFGASAAENRRRAGLGKPETFNFLGFTHICVKARNGRFTVLRQTMRKRLQAKLGEVKAELRRRLHDPVSVVGAWLRSVILGHLQYYGVPMNWRALFAFCSQVERLWYRALARRSQRGRVSRSRMQRLRGAGYQHRVYFTPILCSASAFGPEARAQCGKSARWGPWRGRWATSVSTPTS